METHYSYNLPHICATFYKWVDGEKRIVYWVPNTHQHSAVWFVLLPLLTQVISVAIY